MDNEYELLTNEARFLLSKFYESYLKDVKSGKSQNVANSFGDSNDIHKNLWPGERFDDVDLYAKELVHRHFLDASFADDIVWTSSLSTSSISFMEHRFGNNLKTIAKGILEIAKLFA